LKSTSNNNGKIIFDLNNVSINDNIFDVPFSFASDEPVVAIDFNVNFNEDKLTYLQIVNENSTNEAAAHFSADDRTLRYTSFNLDTYAPCKPVASIRFETNGSQISAQDLNATLALINGKKADVEVKGVSSGLVTNSVSVYPNPTKGILIVVSDENATVQVLDITGASVLFEGKINALEKEAINLENLSAGIYLLRTFSGNSVDIRKFAIVK
jgi:hypothetical protein